jgi:hypothetical protein
MVLADPACVVADKADHRPTVKIENGRIAATPAGKFFRNETQPRQERAYSFPIQKNTVLRPANTQ